MGGENHIKRSGVSQTTGSSPRGRGKQAGYRLVLPQTRLIPAWAGKTLSATTARGSWERLIPAWAGKTDEGLPWRPPLPAHPRVGGENTTARGSWEIGEGSSPRGRGKPGVGGADRVCRGLIPAWAGKTRASIDDLMLRAAHPRVGGENDCADREGRAQAGSSPRGRGKPPFPPLLRDGLRLIPAWAGKTGFGVGSVVGVGGSSPRGRGKRVLVGARNESLGLIPAWAGKTKVPSRPSCRSWAHPRVGGENIVDKPNILANLGSSPRGRGKPGPSLAVPTVRGLIPAWAGKTDGVSLPLPLESGSSPRGRGKQPQLSVRFVEWRLIPAWAGKTDNGLGVHGFGPGSSPRGRGKLDRELLAEIDDGLIPAWAGKT